MRPLPGGDALPPAIRPRSRKSSVDHPAVPSSNVPTAFFMKREEDLEPSASSTQSHEPKARTGDGSFGVQSLADTLEAAFGPESSIASKTTDSSSQVKHHERVSPRSNSHSSSLGSGQASESCRPSPLQKLKKKLSTPVSPVPPRLPRAIARPSQPPSAIPSSPRSTSLQSLKLSDEDSIRDEVASQAITSSDEEEDDTGTQPGISSSFPQLVMPSIQIPTRRPFTTKGKAMGKLKVMVAGEAGVGKSALIRSIIQLCEDIVHVDTPSPSSSFSQPSPPKSKTRKSKTEYGGTARITEIHASTKPYPHWWTDPEEARVLRRRKSSADAVLERNICFVDTPGYSRGSSECDDMSRIVDYVESLLYQTSSVTTLEDGDMLGVISGSGGVVIDVVLYLLTPNQDISKDIVFMQRLSALTNVIPVIAKSDTLSMQEAVSLKASILARLQTTSIRPFMFGKAIEDALLAVQGLPIKLTYATASGSTTESPQYPFTTPTHPYALSSTPGPDDDNMDASLLMSPEYVQPLLPSELTALVNQVFDPDSIAWLRHSAAKKFLAWRRRTKLPSDSFIMHTLQHPRSPTTASIGLNGANMNPSSTSSMFSVASPSGFLVPRSVSPFYHSSLQSPFLASSPSLANSESMEHPADFSLTRYNNFAQGEQRLTDVRIAKWATDLQRSLRNERDRFDELQSNDRAKWLLERVSEEVSRGTIVASPGGSPRADWAVVRHGDEKHGSRSGQRYKKAAGIDSRDPLGLCDLSDEMRRRGFVLVKVLGGVSVVGAVIVAVVRACGLETGLPQGGWWSWLTGGIE